LLPSDIPNAPIVLEHCWVCEKKFTEFGGEPSNFRHQHHLVPRAYGGTDGPTVSLCDSHHTTLHQIALKLYSGKPYFDLLTNNTIQDKRVLWMASLVANARRLTENDPNKPMILTVVADKTLKDKLRKLKTVFPRNTSFPALIKHAVEQLYRKTFQDQD